MGAGTAPVRRPVIAADPDRRCKPRPGARCYNAPADLRAPHPVTASLRKKLLAYGLLLVYVLALEWIWGWKTLLEPWRSFSLTTAVVAIVLLFVSYALRAVRLYDYFRREVGGRFPECLKLMLFHNLFNNLLPMRSGEISFPVLMKRYFEVPVVRSVPALVWFRVLDLHTILAIGGAAALLYHFGPTQAAWLLPLWLVLPWAAHLLKGRVHGRLQSADGRVASLLAQALQGLPASDADFWRAWLWTWINWLVKLAVLAWLLLQFIEASWAAAWLGAIAGDLTSVLPIHAPGGFGTFEAGVLAGLMPFGVALEPAMTAAVNLHLSILFSSLASGILAWWLPAARNLATTR